MKKGRLIVFEGLDCSFKETNSKAYLEHLLSKGKKAVLYSFPRYGSESSYFVKEYLAGNYGDTRDLNNGAVAMCYMIDMFDCVEKEIVPKLKEGYTVVLDRYWYSNLYFRVGINELTNNSHYNHKTVHDIITVSEYFGLPEADFLIKLKSDPKIMLDLVHKKNSKDDQHESNDDLLLSVADVFNNYDLPIYVKEKVVDIYTTKDGEIRSRVDIFNDVLEAVGDE